MDLAMPQIDGITAIQRIKADARLQQTRVILLTATTSPREERTRSGGRSVPEEAMST
jgi:CheY-like chemotaxis protein